MSTAYFGTVSGDNPYGYWRLGEPSGTTAFDASINGYNGTYNGTYTLAQGGAIASDNSTSTLFDGSTAYVTLPQAADGANLGAFSVECWAYLSNITYVTTPTIAGSGAAIANNTGWTLAAIASGGGFKFNIGTGSAHGGVQWSTSLTAATWYHIVATWDGSTVTLYTNGVSRGTAALSGTIAATGVVPNIGKDPTSSGSFFPGRIDEVSTYKYCLTGTQVTNHYNAGLAVNFNLYQIATNTKFRVLQSEDINQILYTLHQPSGGQELGHYFLGANGYTTNAVVSWYVPSLSRGSVPVSVTLDATDQSNSGYVSTPANNQNITANGFEAWDTTSAAQTNAVIGGKYTIQY